MSWLPMYATTKDLAQLVEFLNDSEEIAFIVSNGPNQWIAAHRIDVLEPKKYKLWHMPSGPLPLIRKDEPDGLIEDPLAGWTEFCMGRDTTVPWFGPGHPGVFELHIRQDKVSEDGTYYIPISSFGWIGNRYRIIGFPAHPSTEKYWNKLKRWLKKNGTQVSRGGPSDAYKPEIWAFEDAIVQFAKGAKGVTNPFDLT